VFDTVLDDPAVDPVKVVLGEEEREVLGLDLDVRLGEEHAAVVVQLHDAKRPQEAAPGRPNSFVKNATDRSLSSAKTMAWFRDMGTGIPYVTAPPHLARSVTGTRRASRRR
jgi:hypothetical protein